MCLHSRLIDSIEHHYYTHTVCQDLYLFLFLASCVSHREGGEGQADASKAVQGESEEDERWQHYREEEEHREGVKAWIHFLRTRFWAHVVQKAELDKVNSTQLDEVRSWLSWGGGIKNVGHRLSNFKMYGKGFSNFQIFRWSAWRWSSSLKGSSQQGNKNTAF